jgi:hypothetical protein
MPLVQKAYQAKSPDMNSPDMNSPNPDTEPSTSTN